MFTSFAQAYTFPGNLPPGCSGSNGSYTCSSLNLYQTVTFTDSGNVNITVNGDMQTNGINIGSASQAANVTFNISAYSPRVDILSSGTVYANFNITTTSSLGNIDIVINGNVVINGNITAIGQDYLDFDMYDNAIVNGDIDLYGPDASRADLHSNATVNGYLYSRSDDTDDGDVTLSDPGSTVNGDVQAYGDIRNSGVITGCAQITNDTYYGARLYLYSGSSTNAICKGTPGACQSSSSYLYNYSGSTPPNCAAGPAELVAQYHLDETSWDGTANETKETANYSGGPFDGQGIGSPKPTVSAVDPALNVNSGAAGTCGYAEFSGAIDGSAFTLDNLPVNTASGSETSVSFWMYWDGSTSTKLAMGFNTYYLLFRNGNFGFGSGNSDLYGISASGLANGWHHVVGVFNDSNVTSSRLYIDGVLQTLTQRASSPNNSNAQVTNLITLSGWGYSNTGRFDSGRIDEVKVYSGRVTQAQVDTDFNASHDCLYPAPVDNLAPSATLASSNVVKSWDDINGVNDNFTPTSSYYEYGGNNPLTYSNCCTNGQLDWVEFSWTTSKKLTEFQVFWWDDTVFGHSVTVPSTAYVEYWNGTSWVNLGNIGTALHQFNSLAINDIITSKVRVSMQSSAIIGILEVRIFGEEAPALIAEYHLDENSWDGSSNELIDSAGYSSGPYHGTGIGSPKPTAEHQSPAVSGSTGTCGYAYFNGSDSGGPAFSMSGLPLSTAANDKTTVSFWMKWNGVSARMPIGFDSYMLSFSGTQFGFYTGATGTGSYWGIDASGLINTWHHVVAVFNNNDISKSKIYLDGAEQTLTEYYDSGNAATTTSVVDSNMQISGYTSGTNTRFAGSYIDEVKIYKGEIDQTQVTADYNATHACPSYVVNIDASSFTCISLEEAASSAGHLYMQKIATDFSIKVVALKTDGTPETGFSALSAKDVTLAFVDQTNSNNPIEFRANGSDMFGKTVTFPAGDNTGIVQVDQLRIIPAYRDLKCQITDANQSPTLVTTSADNFSVRPTDISTIQSNTANADTSGTSTSNTPAIKAGDSFHIAASPSVSNYDGTFKIDHTKIMAHTGAYQVGTLTGAFGQASPTSYGWSQSSSFTYSEVGYFKFGQYGIYDDNFTQVDISNGDCTDDFSTTAVSGKYGWFGNTIESNFIGRFTPDVFNVDDGSVVFSGVCDTSSITSNAGSTLTYYDQTPGFSSTITIRAQNTNGDRTQNYQGGFAKLDVVNWTSGADSYGLRYTASNLLANSSLDAVNSSITSSSGWSQGQAIISSNIAVSASQPVAELAAINMQVDPIDTDNVGVVSGTPETISGSSQHTLRYGRLAMQNAYGSELQGLSVPIEVQYWDGTAYRTNGLDDLTTCTSLATNEVTLSNHTQNLSVGDTTVSGITISASNAAKASIQLTAPGVGNSGSVNLDYDLTNLSWFGSNPSAKATFGLHKSPIIYLREAY